MVAPRTRRHATVLALLCGAAFLAGGAVATLVGGPTSVDVAVHGRTVQVATSGSVAAAEPEPEPAPADGDAFTLQELEEGQVSAARFNAFWAAEVARIDAAPCPAPSGAGVTRVVLSVGATAPPHLGPDYEDWAPVLTVARERAASACG